MIVGAAVIELHLHGCRSLKEKRGVIRSINRRIRNRFNLSVAEVGGQDKWQSCWLGLVVAGSDATTVRRVLDKAGIFVEELHLAEVRSIDVEVVELPHYEAPWDGEEPEL